MGFIFDPSKGETAESDVSPERRRLLEAFMGAQQMPQNLGQGLSAVGRALAYRAAEAKAQGPFPDAPVGPNGLKQPVGLGTMFANHFGFRRGGLF